jgi:hypothetical protein
MSTPDPASVAATLEECLDELNDSLVRLDRFPHTVLAFALRSHLAGLLQALLAHGECTHPQAVMFLKELESEALQPGGGDRA